ncbi:phosphotransferase [Streptomyces sp. NBC_00582]|uniref:phosphotransferase n=1 Tax=Streptomyces sp. NBC_00582 TaxID=2975783 RepID=UPI002E803D35|nr:phosphotransferase [Streptomyces sp. NBC_00582]WUB60727.1 phosphotransferase [Streptomyces sp. NBC_00582]
MPHIITPRLRYSSTAVRPGWDQLPQGIRQLISRRLGGAVDAGPSAGSGFTSGFAAVVHTAGGSQFIKAINDVENAVIAACYRRESLINQALPVEVPAPRLRWVEEQDEWVVLGFDAVDGGRMPAEPWQPSDLDATLNAYAAAAEMLSAPSAQLLRLGLKPVSAEGDFTAWRDLQAGSAKAELLPAWVPLPRTRQLAELESHWREATAGNAVLHHDLRLDNVLIDAGGAAWICDWNWPCFGASWFDLVLLLATAFADGYDATALFAAHPTARGVADEQLDAALAALSGFFLVSGAQPPADWSPHLRRHQTWCGEVTLRWLVDRRGWTI